MTEKEIEPIGFVIGYGLHAKTCYTLKMKWSRDPALRSLVFATPGIAMTILVALIYSENSLLSAIFSGFSGLAQLYITFLLLLIAQSVGLVFAFKLLSKSQHGDLSRLLRMFFYILLFATVFLPLTTFFPS